MTAPLLRPALPLVGNAIEFRRDRLGLLGRLHRDAGELATVRLGPMRVPIGTSAEFARAVLVEQAASFGKGRGLGVFARPLLGDGLLSASNDIHRRQRKLMAPKFTRKHIGQLADCMARLTDETQRNWRDGQQVDVADAMMRLTLEITARTLFDADAEQVADDVARSLSVVNRYISAAISSPIHVPYAWPTPGNRRVKRAVARMDEIIGDIIRRRRAGEPRPDILSLLLAARDDDGAGMSDRQVRDEVMNLLVAGHETTANALAWALYLLATHPAIYARLRTEADAVLGDRRPTLADVPALDYATRVFKEALRLYPPGYVIARQALEDVDVCGHPVTAGTLVIANIYGMHRRSDYFADPDRFDPDRFSAAAEAALPRHTYLPFGAGPRVCIGNYFAMMEGALVLAILARNIELDWIGDAPVVGDPMVTLRPRGAINMRIRRRTPAGSRGARPPAPALSFAG